MFCYSNEVGYACIFVKKLVCYNELTVNILHYLHNRVGGGFYRRGGEAPKAVKWEDRIIQIFEGSWSYVIGSGSIGRSPGMHSFFKASITVQTFFDKMTVAYLDCSCLSIFMCLFSWYHLEQRNWLGRLHQKLRKKSSKPHGNSHPEWNL